MIIDPAMDFDIRACHALSGSSLPYEVWRETHVKTFESRFPSLHIPDYPKTFHIWLRANARALSIIEHPSAVH